MCLWFICVCVSVCDMCVWYVIYACMCIYVWCMCVEGGICGGMCMVCVCYVVCVCVCGWEWCDICVFVLYVCVVRSV